MKSMAKDIVKVTKKVVADKPMAMEKMYPRLSVTSKEMPDLEDMKVGDTGTMKINFKVCAIREGYDDKKMLNCDMDITKVMEIDGVEDMKEARRMNINRKDYDELKGKDAKKS